MKSLDVGRVKAREREDKVITLVVHLSAQRWRMQESVGYDWEEKEKKRCEDVSCACSSAFQWTNGHVFTVLNVYQGRGRID